MDLLLNRRPKEILTALILIFIGLPLLFFPAFKFYLYAVANPDNPAVIILKSPEFFFVYFVSYAWLFSTLSIPLCWAYYDVYVRDGGGKRETGLTPPDGEEPQAH